MTDPIWPPRRPNAQRTLYPTGLSICALLLASLPGTVRADDWLNWRGPHGNNIARGESPPIRWSDEQNLAWKSPVPGRGHSSPIVVGQQVILTTADPQNQVQSVLAFDRATGKQLWKTDVNRGGFLAQIHPKNTHASSTVSSDGQSLFAVFCFQDQVHLFALDPNGKLLWKRTAGDFKPQKYKFGYGPSPLLYHDLVIVSSEFEADGFLAAFDKSTGKPSWRAARKDFISYSSPIVARIDNQDQLLMSGRKRIASYDPASGKLRWEANAVSSVTCGTPVWDDQRIYVSGGFPETATLAMRADGSGEILWRNNVKCYEQSLLVSNGYLYGLSDQGIAYCWRATDGQEMWKRRLGGNVSTSPILTEDRLIMANEAGKVFVIQATPEKFVLLAENRFGTESFATPAICDGQMFVRYAIGQEAERQEWLVCISQQVQP